MLAIYRTIRYFFRLFNYDIVRYSFNDRGLNPYLDMKHYIRKSDPIILDVGANLGESIESLIASYPSAQIYSFEPSIESFSVLTSKYRNSNFIKLYNEPLGSCKCKRWFYDNDLSYMSSFLELGTFGYGNIRGMRHLELRPIDNFVDSVGLNHIDILKIDAQGSEYDILLGCSNLLRENRINVIHVELTLTDMYQGSASVEEIIKLLYENNFALCGIYRQHFQNGYLSWADGLFVNRSFINDY